MSLEDKFKLLDKYVQMKTSEDIKNFEITVWELAETKDPEVLDKLIDYFDDNCEYLEVMWSLLHAIETYPDEIYVSIIVKKFRNKIDKYYNWFKSIMYGILNHSKCYEIFKCKLKFSNKTKILDFLNNLEINSSEQKLLIEELKKELEN